MTTACCLEPSLATNATVSDDPTNTRDLREAFLQEIRRRFRRLRGLVRRAVGYATDALDLTGNADVPEPFEYETDRGLIESFMAWFKQAVEDEVLEPVGYSGRRAGEHWSAQYVRGAVGRGWQNASGRLMQAGVQVTAEDSVEAVLQLPVTQAMLRRLYTRVFENLQDITDESADVIRQELAQGLAEGANPRKMARRLTSEIRDLQRTRAETLARTEVIHAHSEAALTRYESAGVDRVVHGEWATADDGRVCPICESLEGRELSTSEMRTGTFEFEPDDDQPDSLAGTYPLLPPAHPNGRCTILPVVT